MAVVRFSFKAAIKELNAVSVCSFSLVLFSAGDEGLTDSEIDLLCFREPLLGECDFLLLNLDLKYLIPTGDLDLILLLLGLLDLDRRLREDTDLDRDLRYLYFLLQGDTDLDRLLNLHGDLDCDLKNLLCLLGLGLFLVGEYESQLLTGDKDL